MIRGLAVVGLDLLLLLDLGFQKYVRLSAPEELAEHPLEMLAHRGERLLEAQAAFRIDLGDELFELLFAGRQVVDLIGQEGRALFQLLQLADGIEVDVPEALDLLAQLLDLIGDRVPIHVGGLVPAGGFVLGVFSRKVELELFLRALHERFEAHAQLIALHFQVVNDMLDLGVLAPQGIDVGFELFEDLAGLLKQARRYLDFADEGLLLLDEQRLLPLRLL